MENQTGIQTLCENQYDYFQNLIEQGLFFENSGQYEKAFNIYKTGYNMSLDDDIRSLFSAFLLGLID
jgi:hypothetical protein